MPRYRFTLTTHRLHDCGFDFELEQPGDPEALALSHRWAEGSFEIVDVWDGTRRVSPARLPPD